MWKFLGSWWDILWASSLSLPWTPRTYSVPVWLGNSLDHKNEKMWLLCVSLCQSESNAPASILRCQRGTSCGCSASYNCFSWKTITKPYSALTRMAIQWRHTYLCKTYCWLQIQKRGWKFCNYKDIFYLRVHNENVKTFCTLTRVHYWTSILCSGH